MTDTQGNGKGTILVVDDDLKVLTILEEALRLYGYSPQACHGAEDALKTFKKNPDAFDVVMTDQAMPGMTGDQLIREIRKLRADVPVVLCTGYADYALDDSEQAINAFTCLKKPFSMSALADVLAEILQSTKETS